MRAGATQAQVDHVIERIERAGARAHPLPGEAVTVIGAIGADRAVIASLALEGEPGVERVMPILKPFKLVSREISPESRTVEVAGRRIGPGHFCLIAGPCTVENMAQTRETGRIVKAAGANLMRGGAFKPRTSPYAFQGLGSEGLDILAEVRAEVGLPVVTEAMDAGQLEEVIEVLGVEQTMVQIGARNMQNFDLLREVGRAGIPVLLKRGLMNTIEEWLLSAEYIAAEGNTDIVLCERGIRTFETATRSTLDLSAVPVAKSLSSLPVIVDPSHAPGRRDLVLPLALAAVAVGADGLIVEVHPEPEHALCDGPQALRAGEFGEWATQVTELAAALGRERSDAD